MKLVLSGLAALAASASSAHATGMHTQIFACESTVNGPSYRLSYYSTSAPGGPVSHWYEFSSTTMEAIPRTVSFRLTPDGATIDEQGAVVERYTSVEPNSTGSLEVRRIGDQRFLRADLRLTVGVDQEFVTSGWMELGDDEVCSWHDAG